MNDISVIIPAYNREHFIGATLESLLNQTLPADEIIVVDDGSTDGTISVAKSFGASVKVIKQKNLGPAAARNVGFAASSGQFIHFFDSDDLAAPNKHEIQLATLKKSGADIAYAPWVKGRLEQNAFIPENHVLQQKGLPQGDLMKALLTTWSIVPHACFFRRSIVEKSGGFPEHLFVGEDQMMFLNCLFQGAKVMHSPGTIELYRVVESEEKLTADAGKNRRVAHWARFLVDADADCLAHGVNVREWFGFRLRAWESLQDLRKLGIEEKGLVMRLKEILGDKIPDFSYSLARKFKRKWLGLKWRLTGGRAEASFCPGLITLEQSALISCMGLKLGSQSVFRK